MIRILHFADIINRHDFIDTIIQFGNPGLFQFGVAVREIDTNIALPEYNSRIPRWSLPGTSREKMFHSLLGLIRIIRQWKPHILHTHHFDQAILGWLATRSHPKTKLIIGRHYSDSIYRLSTSLKKSAYLFFENIVNRGAMRIIVPSKYIETILVEWQNIRSEKVVRIPYGFSATKYNTAFPEKHEELWTSLGLRGAYVLGNFSRLHEEKGHRFLIQAMSQLRSQFPKLHLIICGEGPERRSIEKQIAENQLQDRIHLLGWRRDAISIMASVDAVVQPTLQEAFSQVMAESLWMRKPLIITDVSGATDIISNGINGLLVPKNDSMALVNAITRLIKDPSLQHQLAIAGRSYVESHLSIETIVPLYEQVYKDVLES